MRTPGVAAWAGASKDGWSGTDEERAEDAKYPGVLPGWVSGSFQGGSGMRSGPILILILILILSSLPHLHQQRCRALRARPPVQPPPRPTPHLPPVPYAPPLTNPPPRTPHHRVALLTRTRLPSSSTTPCTRRLRRAPRCAPRWTSRSVGRAPTSASVPARRAPSSARPWRRRKAP
eukprot:354526-Chlamydomonas_euryale.AAC.2